MATKRAKKMIFLSVLTMSIAMGGLAASLYYVLKEGAELRVRAQAVADHTAQQQLYANLASLVERTAGEREALQKYVLTEDDTISFLADIESLAAERGITLVTDALTVVTSKPNNTLMVNFSLTGTEVAVYDFVSLLEVLPYMSYLTNVVVRRDATTGLADSTVTLAITLANHDSKN